MFHHIISRISGAYVRSLSTKSALPTEQYIINAFRRGNYETAVTLFSQRPRRLRSDALHEAAILACALIPDATAARVVLNSMPAPTYAAVASVVTALCHERDVGSAVSVLERAVHSGLNLDDRLWLSVTRAAERTNHADIKARLLNLEPRTDRHMSRAPLSPAGFFIDGNEREPMAHPERMGRQPRNARSIVRSERRLRAAAPSLLQVESVWSDIASNPVLSADVGVVSAGVTAFSRCGGIGGARAVNTLMTWVRHQLYDKTTQRGKPCYTSSLTAMALLVTASTTALAAAAQTDPVLALSAYDALIAMKLPAFSRSLPFTGAYLKVLQHANLSLPDTRARIDCAWSHHIQLDEQAFSMALGAILRCDARVIDKLDHAREWVDIMRSAGIPLTVHTYNLFAGQLRYCNDPQMITTLLSDMKRAGVKPTPVTYGLIFSACVMQGEYVSGTRRNALPVSVWDEVLNGMEEHMRSAGIEHTSYSMLSLARAYGHLGQSGRALKVFDAFIASNEKDFDQPSSRTKLKDAFCQMIYNLTHCRDCRANGPDAALILFDKMVSLNLTPCGDILDALLVACVRANKPSKGVELVAGFMKEGYRCDVGISGMKHLLYAHSQLQNPTYWNVTRVFVKKNEHLLKTSELQAATKAVIIQFARLGQRQVCEDIMNLSRISMPDLHFIYNGKEFSRFRSRCHQAVITPESPTIPPVALNTKHGEDKTSDTRHASMNTSIRSILNNSTLLPVT